MKSFGMGLALLIAGAVLAIVTSMMPEVLPETYAPWWLDGAWGDILGAGPYIGIGVMVLGVVWYWIMEPVLYLTSPPPQKAPTTLPISAGGESEEEAAPAVLMEKGLGEWVSEAVDEKLAREKGKKR